MDIVWGVMYMMAALLTGTGWIIYYILKLAYDEMHEETLVIDDPVVPTVSSESEPTLREVPV
jgi:hypothetical protein